MRRVVLPFALVLLLTVAIAASRGGDSPRPAPVPTTVSVGSTSQLANAEVAVGTLERYVEATERQQVGEYLAARAQADLAVYVASIPAPAPALRPTTAAPATAAPAVQQTSWPSSLDPCGGDLPPCYVKARESGGDYNAQNPSSSASGAWQFLDSTWAGYGGYARAVYAPPALQDAKARELWAGGAGCGHWSAC